ncbi:hypothetical protein [Haladaptatus sp. NG-SE-30]
MPTNRTRRLGIASALGLVGGGVIALRGYLVPGTPQFAPRITDVLEAERYRQGTTDRPAEVGSLVGELDDDASEQVVETLLDAGVVHAVGDSLHLDEGFRTDWRAAMTSVRDADLGRAVREATPQPVDVELAEGGDWVIISTGGLESEQWLTRPVAIAEVAAVRALAGYGIDPDVGVQSASALRAFLHDCPNCDVELEATTASGCCGSERSSLSPPDDVLACPSCDQRVFTF